MAIKTYMPQIAITAISRAKPAVNDTNWGSYNTIYLDEHLGDLGDVQIAKSLTNPMGSFTITLPDKPLKGSGSGSTNPNAAINDSVYGFIQPMDTVDFQFSHEPGTLSEQPIIMRGIVTNVSRSETIGSDGAPQRVVVIQGNDFGLVFNLIRLMPPSSELANIGIRLAGYALAKLLGILEAVSTISVPDFYTHIINTTNEWLRNNDALKGTKITLDCKVVGTTGIFINKYDPVDAALWNIMAKYIDSTFNEIFVEDREDGTYLVIRPNPYYDISNGAWIQVDQNSDPQPTRVPIDVTDIIEITAARSEDKTFNLPYIKSQAFPMSESGKTFDIIKYVEDQKYGEYINSKATVYGYRILTRDFVQIPVSVVNPGTNQKEAQVIQNIANTIDFNKRRVDTVWNSIKDNVVFESGSMTLKGNHLVMPGRYLDITRGQFTFSVYVESVVHRFQPYGSYTTTITYIRGTGYAERIQMLPSPYLMEGRRGVY
jgi:hypothetical protein